MYRVRHYISPKVLSKDVLPVPQADTIATLLPGKNKIARGTSRKTLTEPRGLT